MRTKRRKSASRRSTGAGEQIKVRGFFRIHIVEDRDRRGRLLKRPRVVGDSGWRENLVVNLGFDQFLCQTLGGMAGSKTISHMALGTGAAPAAADTSLSGEITHATNSRKTVTPTTIASKTLQLAATYASADSFITASANISNVGLFNTSTTSAGTIFAGNTYTSSALATNQNVNASYQIRFA